MLCSSLSCNKNVCCELLGHITRNLYLFFKRNLYLIVVVDHGRILLKMKVMFSSVVARGYLSDERLKGMRSVNKERTERSI